MDTKVVTINVNGRKVELAEARVLLGVPEGECLGCWLGDDGVDTHDVCGGWAYFGVDV